MTINKTIEQRGENYGCFQVTSETAQRLKHVMRSTPNWNSLTPAKKEALEMICTKVSRILCGTKDKKDNWHDIAGYSVNVENGMPDDEA